MRLFFERVATHVTYSFDSIGLRENFIDMIKCFRFSRGKYMLFVFATVNFSRSEVDLNAVNVFVGSWDMRTINFIILHQYH